MICDSAQSLSDTNVVDLWRAGLGRRETQQKNGCAADDHEGRQPRKFFGGGYGLRPAQIWGLAFLLSV